MVNVSEALVGRRVRVTAATCGNERCTACPRSIGQEGALEGFDGSSDRHGQLVTDDGRRYDYITEVELLDEPVFAPGSIVEVTGDDNRHGWPVGTQVTLTQAPDADSYRGWLATTRPWFVGSPVPRHIPREGAEVRFIRESNFRAVTTPPAETFELAGRTFTVGQQMNRTGGSNNPVTVLSPTDERYTSRYGGMASHVPTINSAGFVDGLWPGSLVEITTATTTEETTMPASSRVTFTPEQAQRLREVVGDFGRRHGACAVAADALRELGVDQPQLTQSVTIQITMTVPVANYSGQVQLPEGAPEGYLSRAIGTGQLNSLADRMITDGGSRLRRQGDATAEITSISAS